MPEEQPLDEVTFDQAWRSTHNFIAKFGPALRSLEIMFSKARDVEAFLANDAVAEKETVIAGLDAQIESKNVELAVVGEALDELKRNITVAEVDFDKRKREMRAQQDAEVKAFNEQRAALEERIAKLQEVNKNLMVREGDLQRKIDSELAKLAGVQDRIKAANAALGVS